MNQKNIRKINYKGGELIDLSYNCEQQQEIFLDYLAMFSNKYFIPTKSSYIYNLNIFNIISMIFKEKNLYLNNEFGDNDLKVLFDKIYKVTNINDIDQIVDNLQNEHNYNIKKKVKEMVLELDKNYVNNNVNAPVLALFKYLEHHCSIKSDILVGGLNYGLKFHLNKQLQIDDSSYYNIDISNFIYYDEDLKEFKYCLQYLLIIAIVIDFLFAINKNLLYKSYETQKKFKDIFKELGQHLSKKNKKINNIQLSYDDYRYNISLIFNLLDRYQDKDVFTNGARMQLFIEGIFQENINDIKYQLRKAINLIKNISTGESKNKTIQSRCIYFLSTLIFNIKRFTKPIIVAIKIIYKYKI